MGALRLRIQGVTRVGARIQGIVVGTTPGTVTGIVGTSAPELTPRLPISTEPKGTPVRGTPPGTVGDVGAEDAVRLFEPEPHIPDIPAVSIAPEAEMVEFCIIPEVDSPEVAEIPGDTAGGAAVAPAAAPVAGELVIDIPPPSKVAPEPNIWDDEVPTVEHGMPSEGTAIVPVGLDGRGLNPADVISVEPSGIPVGETGDSDDALPRGEVSPIAGVGTTIPFICARARLPTSSTGRAAAIGYNFILTSVL
jgi:hypothetical protein